MDNNAHGFYVGEYRHALDAKNRLTVPSKWRFKGDESDTAYLALPNPNGSITVYPPEQVQRLKAKIAEVSMLGDPVRVRAITRIFADGYQFGPDRQGRIGLTEKLVRHAGIEKEAVLAGLVNTFTIWNPQRYQRYIQAEEDSASLAATLKDLGL